MSALVDIIYLGEYHHVPMVEGEYYRCYIMYVITYRVDAVSGDFLRYQHKYIFYDP